jgi:hypothetical protein
MPWVRLRKRERMVKTNFKRRNSTRFCFMSSPRANARINIKEPREETFETGFRDQDSVGCLAGTGEPL